MPGRAYNGERYKFGFNGQEKGDEVYGDGNAYTAMFWEYDPRLGRRWNLDPKSDCSYSEYSAFANNPIMFCDPDGDTVKYAKFSDRLNSWIAFALSKKYRETWNKMQNKEQSYYLNKDNKGPLLKDVNPEFYENGEGPLVSVDVKYGGLFDCFLDSEDAENIGGENQKKELKWGMVFSVDVGNANSENVFYIIAWKTGNWKNYTFFGRSRSKAVITLQDAMRIEQSSRQISRINSRRREYNHQNDLKPGDKKYKPLHKKNWINVLYVQ
jgi:hypothetical protein